MRGRLGGQILPSKEKVDLVDEDDNVIGSAYLDDCLSGGLLHRAVAVLVRRGNGNFVLQRRSLHDRWHPGLWTLSSTGHVKERESYDAAAARELFEELGLDAEPRAVAKVKIPPIVDGPMTEYEWISLYEAATDDEFTIDKSELESAREFTEGSLRTMIESGQMTPDSLQLLNVYLQRTHGTV